jgi:hypothetical protein
MTRTAGTDYEVKLNPEPSAIQLVMFRRHKARRTSPGNPKWYRPQMVKPFAFAACRPSVYPKLPTGAQHFTANATTTDRQSNPFKHLHAGMSVQDYVREYFLGRKFVA